MTGALFNEIEPYAAEWLGNLIAAGHIAPGDVDARSIADLQPADLAGRTQAHFFAGIGVWSYALRLAGWPDTRPVWTGSCPCQPFSSAGKRGGQSDARHLWPEWFRLIRACRPPIIFGEQVASADVLGKVGGGTAAELPWFDVVSGDLEGEGYTVGAAVLGAHSVGAPHIRQRLYFVAYSERWAAERRRYDLAAETGGTQSAAQERKRLRIDARNGSEPRAVAYASGDERGAGRAGEESSGRGAAREQPAGLRDAQFVGDADDAGPQGRSLQSGERAGQRAPGSNGATRGFWADAEWIACIDGKARAVEPGTFPLAHGAPARVERLRAYGNAIIAETAATFIRAVMEALS